MDLWRERISFLALGIVLGVAAGAATTWIWICR
jgi:hypothetical protein